MTTTTYLPAKAGPVELDWNQLYPVVQRVCREVSTHWSHIIDPDDLTNEVVVKFLEIQAKHRIPKDVVGWPTSPDLPDDERDSRQTVALRRAAKRWARGMCSEQGRKDAIEQLFLPQRAGFALTPLTPLPSEALSMLSDAFMLYGPTLDAEPTLAWVDLARSQLDKLSEGQRRLIGRFVAGDRVDKSNVNKALRALHEYMAEAEEAAIREYEGPGSRRVVSNIAAMSAFD